MFRQSVEPDAVSHRNGGDCPLLQQVQFYYFTSTTPETLEIEDVFPRINNPIDCGMRSPFRSNTFYPKQNSIKTSLHELKSVGCLLPRGKRVLVFRIEGGPSWYVQNLQNGSNTDRVFKELLASLTRIPSSKYTLPAKRENSFSHHWLSGVNFGEGTIHRIQMILHALNSPKTSCVFRTARAPEAQQKKDPVRGGFFPPGGNPTTHRPGPTNAGGVSRYQLTKLKRRWYWKSGGRPAFLGAY